MRIAFNSPAWPLRAYPNGIVSYIDYLRPALAALGIDSVVAAGIVADGFASVDVADVRVHRERSVLERVSDRLRRDHRGIGKICAGRSIAHAVESLSRVRGPVDLVEIEESFGMCHHVEEFGRWPVVVRLHGPWFLNGPALGVPRDGAFDLRVRQEGEALAVARQVSSPSLDVLDRTRDYYGLSLEHAAVIPNPCPSVSPERRWRADGADPHRVLFVGRFDAHKGGDLMLDAFAEVLASQPETRLWFAGPDNGVPDPAGGMLDVTAYLERALPEEALRSRVEILGLCESRQIEKMRLEAAVTVVASRYENFPMTVLEAVAHGSPLVATDVGGIGEIVRHEQTGCLVAGGSAAALAEGILRLLADPALAQRLAEEAGRDAEARFSSEAVARATSDFYQRVLASTRP
ncbi:MAG: hypothetical protein CL908_12415 [Deltaproteobacteria bacterium]|nr:hypothetical protein [Deltaproteobacteria bacterium]